MGIYNFGAAMNKGLKTKCLFCEGEIAEVKHINKERDSFDYVCKCCNPNTIIALSGSIVVRNDFDKTWYKFLNTKNRIMTSNDDEFEVLEDDLF